jgi:hypothetical protein
MTIQSDNYESLVASLIEHIRKSARNITGLGSGRSNTIVGVSGQPHQIDVSFTDNDFSPNALVIIECKHFKDDSIQLEHVKVVKAAQDDIRSAEDTPNTVHAIMVTTNGVQSGAQRFANYYGIKTELVKSESEYVFRYENIVLAGITEQATAFDSVEAEKVSPSTTREGV